MSSERDDGGPAFPCWSEKNNHGMSLRDWFAGKAMQAFVQVALETAKIAQSKGEEIMKEAPAASYEIADAMLKARKA